MQFERKEIEAITKVKRVRYKEWINRGYFIPSIQAAKGPGTRIICSREDLYLIDVYKEMHESGWSRKAVGSFIKAIDRKEIRKLIAIGAIFDFRFHREGLLKGEIFKKEKLAKIVGVDPNSEKVQVALEFINKLAIDSMEETLEKISEVDLYLYFWRLKLQKGYEVICGGLAEQRNESKDFVRIYGMYDLSKMQSMAYDVYIYNFRDTLDRINSRLYRLYPEKLHSEDTFIEHAKARAVLELN